MRLSTIHNNSGSSSTRFCIPRFTQPRTRPHVAPAVMTRRRSCCKPSVSMSPACSPSSSTFVRPLSTTTSRPNTTRTTASIDSSTLPSFVTMWSQHQKQQQQQQQHHHHPSACPFCISICDRYFQACSSSSFVICFLCFLFLFFFFKNLFLVFCCVASTL